MTDSRHQLQTIIQTSWRRGQFPSTRPYAHRQTEKYIVSLFSKMMNEVIGDDYPTPNDGCVDSVAEPYYRHLRWQQRLRKEQLLKQLEGK